MAEKKDIPWDMVGDIMKNAVESNMKESRLIAEALKRLV